MERRTARLLLFVSLLVVLWSSSLLLRWFVVLPELASNSRNDAPKLVKVKLRDAPKKPKNDVSTSRAPIKPPLVNHTTLSDESLVIPVVIVTCKRAAYLRRCLDKLVGVLRAHTRGSGNLGMEQEAHALAAWQFPIIVSRDCDDPAVAQVVREFSEEHKHGCEAGLSRRTERHHQQGTDNDINDDGDGICVREWRQPDRRPIESYAAISRHFGFIMRSAFEVENFEQAILLEEDLEVAPDFFSYFAATLPLLKSEPDSLYCVSAWADNGAARFVHDPRSLLRSDFFPGLGWMLTREVWRSLPSWPESFWDDWLRDPSQRLGRGCIRPEISRTYTFGEDGVSKGQFFKTHLAQIVLNTEFVDWTRDASAQAVITGLEQVQYDSSFFRRVRDAMVLPSWHDVQQHVHQSGPDEKDKNYDVALIYSSFHQFQSVARTIGIMDDEKAGVPRTAYHGVVSVRLGSQTVFVYSPSLLP